MGSGERLEHDSAKDWLHGRHVVFVVNVDWFFLSHRLPVAVAAREAGARVSVLARDTGQAGRITQHGLAFFDVPISRGTRNPLRDLTYLLRLGRLYRRLRPDLLHHVTIKPVLYGTLAARIALPGARIVNAISGLGLSFADNARRASLRRIVEMLYRVALRHPHQRTVFQNPDDRERFLRQGLVSRQRSVLIRGSGVDCVQFAPTPLPLHPAVVLFASRMLWEKGVGTFVDAARLVRTALPDARMVLAGVPDPDNPSSIPEETLRRWAADGVIEWWGHREDMPAVLAEATVVALPTSYPEGVPKILIEAAAAGRPLIATDTPGCREIVRPDRTGILTPPREPGALANAILELLADPERLRRYGREAREVACSEFSLDRVLEQTLGLYRSLLGTSADLG
jgi:glycosyltransferase involved in cell wall biosynthesis